MSNLTMEQGMEAIMSIIEGGQPIQEVIPASSTIPQETVYDGQGHILSVNGKKTTTGYKKGARRVSNPKDTARKELLDAAEVLLNRVAAFSGKVGRNSVEGVVVRLSDADYCVKCTGHAKAEYANREEDFVPSKNFITRGKTENHSPAIAKVLVAEIENEFSNSIFKIENEKRVALLEAKSSGIRFEVAGVEYSYKITKKRSRVVIG